MHRHSRPIVSHVTKHSRGLRLRYYCIPGTNVLLLITPRTRAISGDAA